MCPLRSLSAAAVMTALVTTGSLVAAEEQAPAPAVTPAPAAPVNTAPATAPAKVDGEEQVGIGFEIGLRRYFPLRKPMEEGQSQFVALDLEMAQFRIGYRFELATMRSKADDNLTGIADEVDYETRIHEIRVQRSVYDDAIRVGLAVGMANVRATLAVNGDGGPEGTMFNCQAPTGDVFVILSPITGGKRVEASFNVILGYRILWIPGSDPDQAGTDYQELLHDMSGFHIGMSVSASF